MRIRLARTLAALALVAFQSLPGLAQEAGSASGALVLPPEGNRDTVSQKNYFALRHVASLQRLLTSNPDGVPMELLVAGVKSEARKLAKTYRREGVAPEVLGLVDDLADLAARYERLLADCTLIDRRIVAALENDQADFCWELLAKGAGELASEGVKYLAQVDNIYVKGIALVVGFGVEKLVDHLREQIRNGHLTAQRYEELAAAVGRFQGTVDQDYQRHLRVVTSLCRRYGWDRSRVGYDSTAEEVAPFRQPITDRGNIEARLKSLKAWADRRPNDPFAALDYARLAGKQQIDNRPTEKGALEANAAHLLTFARWLRERARDIPPGESFDSTRLMLWREAGHLANNGALQHNVAKVGRRYGAACPQASLAVECWEDCLRLVEDEDGFYRMRHAFAVALGGDLRTAKRHAERIADVRKSKKCPLFAQNYAALCSQLGETAEAVEWVEFACRHGGLVPSRLPDDPELAEVRRDFPARLARIAR
jgi:hypothetical protein